jgi:hypothetical protein
MFWLVPDIRRDLVPGSSHLSALSYPLVRDPSIVSDVVLTSTTLPAEVMSVTRFQLLDGTEIPWLGWGNGTGKVLDRTPVALLAMF